MAIHSTAVHTPKLCSYSIGTFLCLPSRWQSLAHSSNNKQIKATSVVESSTEVLNNICLGIPMVDLYTCQHYWYTLSLLATTLREIT